MKKLTHGGMNEAIADEYPWGTKELDERVLKYPSEGAPEGCGRLATKCGVVFFATYDSKAQTLLLCCAHCGNPAFEVEVKNNVEMN